jgi:small ligand-binding sensory domain FIST
MSDRKMIFATATSTRADSLEAASEVVGEVRRKLDGARPDLAFLFLSHHHAPQLEEAVEALARDLDARHLLGSTAESVIGGSVEHWGNTALGLWAAVIPGGELESAHVSLEQTADGFAFLGIPRIPSGPATMILLGEPYSFPTDVFLARMAEDYPELQVLGGMASGAQGPGENRLFLGKEVLIDGAAALIVSGRVRVRPLVSQGCRPFGKPLIVTKAEEGFIRELGGRPAIEKLSEQLEALSPQERAMLERGIHVGLAIDARKQQHHRGDFLVRNVLGVDREDGSVVVTDTVKPGTTIQFHLRDAETASEDLQELLRDARGSGARPRGALLFSCNGRGRRLFSVPNHDASTVARELGEVALAGFFAAGEIGPVGGQNFLHGFTASLALFEDAG